MVTWVKFSSNAISPFRRAINWLVTGMFVFSFGIACADDDDEYDSEIDVEMLSASWTDDGNINVSFQFPYEEGEPYADSEIGLVLCDSGDANCAVVGVNPSIELGRSDAQSVTARGPQLSQLSWVTLFATGYSVCIADDPSGYGFFCAPINVETVSPTTTTVETTAPVTTTTLPPTTTEVTTSTTSTTTTSVASSSGSASSQTSSSSSSSTTTLAPTTTTTTTLAPTTTTTLAPTTTTTLAPTTTTTIYNPLMVDLVWSGDSIGCPGYELYLMIDVTGYTATPTVTSFTVGGQPASARYAWEDDVRYTFEVSEWPTLVDGDHQVYAQVSDGTHTRSATSTVTYACNT